MGLFGIGDGKMVVALKKPNAAPGEQLNGTATLTLNTDVGAKGVFATLYAQRDDTRIGPNGSVSKSTVEIYKKSSSWTAKRPI